MSVQVQMHPLGNHCRRGSGRDRGVSADHRDDYRHACIFVGLAGDRRGLSGSAGSGFRPFPRSVPSARSGILGTALFSVVLLALGVVATSVLSAALVGLLLASFALTLAGSACYVKALTGCGC